MHERLLFDGADCRNRYILSLTGPLSHPHEDTGPSPSHVVVLRYYITAAGYKQA